MGETASPPTQRVKEETQEFSRKNVVLDNEDNRENNEILRTQTPKKLYQRLWRCRILQSMLLWHKVNRPSDDKTRGATHSRPAIVENEQLTC